MIEAIERKEIRQQQLELKLDLFLTIAMPHKPQQESSQTSERYNPKVRQYDEY